VAKAALLLCLATPLAGSAQVNNTTQFAAIHAASGCSASYDSLTDVSSLYAYWDARAGTYETSGETDATEDADGVYTWADLISTRNFVQATAANRAIWRETGGINGAAAVEFVKVTDETDSDWYTSSYSLGFPYTTVLVYSNDGQDSCIFCQADASATNQQIRTASWSDSKLYVAAWDGSSSQATPSTTTYSGWHYGIPYAGQADWRK